MAIVNFTFDRAQVPQNAVNVREGQTDSSENAKTIYLYDTHVGLCLQEFERNGYHDSDFYMIVWNPETQQPEEYCFASTRGWTYPCYSSKPDATPEVQAAYKAYLDRRDREREKRRIARIAATPAKGKTVEIISGRAKIEKGTQGEVFWVGQMKSEYGRDPYPARVGIVVNGRREFVNGKHVRVVGR